MMRMFFYSNLLFLKQHSIIDGISAGIFAIISYVIIYADEFKREQAYKQLPLKF